MSKRAVSGRARERTDEEKWRIPWHQALNSPKEMG